ncbi:MarR family transcriptional regulator [Roseibium denhamense]|uniref:DNA-binding transcriptional regulator, MarR family n=1 Tax=Roseibium denhamense TaxID=76305 RepID=A0ABY1P4T2_9HYPH|nr:MarR family transcriptional regulator [Roseibium denhamense]MTI07295.1 MarR family transcriptional regulator [Roseibium denhamense]SMP25983.1 DNA-binding transcriptional regulator, MarR family [Roseibium denhamense]
MEDGLKTLGYAALGSRLKRLGEKLQAQTADLGDAASQEGLPVPCNPLLAILDKRGPLSVGDLARTLQQAQPGVTRMIHHLKSQNLVATTPDPQDRRISRIALTDEGKARVKRLKESLWPAADQAVQSICEGLSGSFLDQVAQLETRLSQSPLKSRLEGIALADWDQLLEQRSKTQ